MYSFQKSLLICWTIKLFSCVTCGMSLDKTNKQTNQQILNYIGMAGGQTLVALINTFDNNYCHFQLNWSYVVVYVRTFVTVEQTKSWFGELHTTWHFWSLLKFFHLSHRKKSHKIIQNLNPTSKLNCMLKHDKTNSKLCDAFNEHFRLFVLTICEHKLAENMTQTLCTQLRRPLLPTMAFSIFTPSATQ